MSARLPCCVPFCRCTVGAGRIAPHTEWLCGKHWRLVSGRLRRRKRKAQHLLRRARRLGLEKPLIADRAGATWEACKAEAIERAAGVG